MWLAIDTETYEYFDGSKESENFIVSQMITQGDKRKFRKEKQKGFYYPVLNARKFVLGCLVTETGFKKDFYDYKEMAKYILELIEQEARKGKRTFIYAHNMKYDFYSVFKDELLNQRMKIICESPFLGTWFCQGKPTKRNPKGWDNWGFFLDSYSFFRNMSVDNIGSILGLPKGKMPERVKEPQELAEYCFRDTEIVLNGMKFLKERLNELGFKPRKFLTAGQVAMTTFMSYIRKNNLHWNIMHSGEVYKSEHLEKCRPAYRGGRNEAYKTGKFDKVSYVDVNSLYPYAMANMPFPKLNEELFVDDPLRDLSLSQILDEKFIGVAECIVEVPKISIGYLPIRYRENLYFPTTHWTARQKNVLTGTWTTLELREAVKRGYVIKAMNWCCLYPVLEINVFEPYIKELYKLRMKSDKQMKIVIKMMLNNLYGKFAQFRLNKEYLLIDRWELQKYKAKGWSWKSNYLSKYIIEKESEVYSPKYTNLMLSLLTTAYARDYLYKHLEKIKKEDILYMDTDSIIMKNWDNYKKFFKISNELGDWKLEHENVDCCIKGEKDYRIANKVKIAGVGKRVTSEMDFDNENEIIQKRIIGIKNAFTDPNTFLNRVGEFQDFKIVLKGKIKQMQYLPESIDERKEWKNWKDYYDSSY